jgi:hypothetical protein
VQIMKQIRHKSVDDVRIYVRDAGGFNGLERSASRKVGSLHRFIILRAESSLELMQDTQTAHASGEEADRSSSVSLEDLAWSRRVRGSLRSCGLRRDSRFETAQLGRE